MSMTQTQQHNVPSLRFPEFSGEWKTDRLSNSSLTVVDGDRGVNYPQKKDFFQSGYCLFLNAKNVTKLGFSFEETAFISQDKDTAMSKGKLNRGDLLLTTRGSVGHVALFDNTVKYENIRINSGMVILRSTDRVDSSSFLFFLFNSPKVTTQIKKTAFGSAQPQLTVKEIKRFWLTKPQSAEQQKIASFLSSVDGKIAQLGKKKALLEQYKKGMMQKLFSQELRFNDAQGNDFPDWEEKRLGDVANIVGGGTPETGKLEYWGGSVQWFTPTEIKQKYLYASKRTLTEEGLKKSSAKKLPIGTLLLSTRATVGDVSIAKNECTTNQGFQSLVVKDGNFNEFWYYWILMNKKELLRRASGSTFLEISKSEIAKIPAPKPCVEEQQKIADFLSSVDQKVDLVSTELDHAKTFKKGLLQQMFI